MNKSQLLALTLGGKLERVANDTLNTVCGVDGKFVGDFVGSSLAKCATVTHIRTFCTFTNHHKVHVARVSKWAHDTGEDGGGSQVHVVVQAEA